MRRRTRLPLVPILTPNLLDVALSPEISLRLSEEIGPHPNQANLLEQTLIQTCHGCHREKFRQTSMIAYRTIAEFPEISSPTSCCSKFICSECLVDHLSSSLNTRLWDCRRSHLRPKCPGGCSNGSIAIYNRRQWDEVFQHMPAEAKKTTLAKYDTVMGMNMQLRSLDTRPGPRALKMAAALHTRMITRGKMRSFFDPEKRGSFGHKQTQTFENGPVELCDVDGEEGTTVSVPIFTGLIHHSTKARECSICTESIQDLQYHSLEEWLELWDGFHGQGMWTILKFPEKLGARCTHEMDVCSSCLQKYLASQVHQRGRSCCEKVACPSFECNRVLTFDEIRLYADQDTFARYDTHLALQFLSGCSNFRWCLQPGCSNGEIYENRSTNPCVSCTKCNFKMCFNHQTPWHKSYTCDQLDALCSESDDHYTKTRDWLLQHTKPCPGCNAPVEKNGGCAHMTCRFKLSNHLMDVFLIHCRRFHMPTPIFLAIIGAKSCPRSGQHNRNQGRQGGHFQGTQGTHIYTEETFQDVMNLNNRRELA
ncbi:hypothetical protein EDB80DRAFT_641965 [Ilyonectria destructans]|nr:hypothetical protein EDB80DRAFT_641965 [Ilyonectria destructans]